MSPSAVAPNTASHSAWQTMSASEWPSRPTGEAISTPPSTSRRPGTRRWASNAVPTRCSAKGHRLALTPAEPHKGRVAGLARGAQAAVEPGADIARQVRVGAERDRHLGRVQLLEPDLRRVDVTRRLAQARARDLRADVGRPERLGHARAHLPLELLRRPVP